MTTTTASFIFPNQLFEVLPKEIKGSKIFLIEEHTYFKEHNYHKQKLLFHRLTMINYSYFLEKNKCQIEYINADDSKSKIGNLLSFFQGNNFQKVLYIDPVDESLSKEINNFIDKHKDIEIELASGSIDSKDFKNKSKQYSDLNEIVPYARKFLSYEVEKRDLENIINDSESDKEILSEAKKELLDLNKKKTQYENKLKVYLLPKDEDDKKNAIVEIRAGTGGLEATIFCSDLFKMYEKVCAKKKWNIEIISISKSDAGGFKEVILNVIGNDIYSYLKYESGVHRVQRVPDAETQGRVHTSAATVAVLPEVEELDIEIKDTDLRIDVFRSGGPGGQSVNTTDSAVRITHIPSGIVVSQQDEKSQHKNKAKALKILRARVYESEKRKKDLKRSEDRKSQIGTGDRSERIRTYNFPQGRITDHRINFTLHKLSEFLSGEIHEEMNETLRLREQDQKLKDVNS